MRSQLRSYLLSQNIKAEGTDRELALRAILASGVSVHLPHMQGDPIAYRSDAYVMAYAAARLDGWRMDEWNPDQPRDEDGKFASAGGGTVEGAVKSGESAIDKVESADDLKKLGASIKGSKVLTPGAKAQLYGKLSGKAMGLNAGEDAQVFSEKAFAEAIQGEEGKDWVNVEDPVTGDQVQGQVLGNEVVLESGEVVKMPGAPKGTLTAESVTASLEGAIAKAQAEQAAKGGGEEAEEVALGDTHTVDIPEFDEDNPEQFEKDIAAQFGPGAVAKQNEDDTITVTTKDGSVYVAMVGSDDADLLFEKTNLTIPSKIQVPSSEKSNAAMSAYIAGQFGPGASAKYGPGDKWTVTTAAGETHVGTPGNDPTEITFESDDDDDGPVEEKNPPHNKSKTSEQSAHSKEAREAAKKITLHAKQLRAEYKKNPTAANKAKVEAAEKAAKAARSAARKAEKSKDAATAKKHAEKAKAHHSKLVGGDEESHGFVVTKAKPVTEQVLNPSEKEYANAKAALSKLGSSKPVATSTTKALQNKADKLKAEADKPHPESWSKEKIAAKEAAKKALIDHADPTTPDELKAAAKAFEDVAKQASAAGSYWGSSYTSLAEEYREAATPREKFEVGKGTSGDHGTAPSKSARPIDSIKGDIVSEKVFKEHRTAYTETLSSKEKSAALNYSGAGYSSMNGHLRKGGEPDATMLALDKAIAKAPAPRDMLVHRGISGKYATDLFNGLEPGDQFVEKAYSSTSAGGSPAFGGDVELNITVPKGYPVAPIPSKHPSEREYLLRRNTKFQVTKIEKVPHYSGEKIIAHVTVVHDSAD